MRKIDATLAGKFQIGATITINRLGYGAMLTHRGPVSGGSPSDREYGARTRLRRLPEIGVNFHRHGRQLRSRVLPEELIREVPSPLSRGFLDRHQGGPYGRRPEPVDAQR